jgi:hypothetical protein
MSNGEQLQDEDAREVWMLTYVSTEHSSREWNLSNFDVVI